MNTVKIETLSDPALSPYRDLTDAGLRNGQPGEGLLIAESLRVIDAALNAGVEPISFLAEENRLEAIEKRCGRFGKHIPVYYGERDLLEKLTGYRLTRGVLCLMKRPPAADPVRLLKEAKKAAVLEGITDSTNVGTVFRSAAALGMDAVILSGDCCDPLCRRSVRVSMGTVFQVPWVKMNGELPAQLKEAGFMTYALALDERAMDIREAGFTLPGKKALFFGTEGTGLKAETVKQADRTVMIPMKNGVDSLNVAAAAAVAFWEMNR